MKVATYLLLGYITLAAAAAQAAEVSPVPTGYFEGSFLNIASNTRTPAQVWIKAASEAGNKSQTFYAVIFQTKSSRASIFRIESLKGGLQAWMQLFQNSDRILAQDIDGEPTYGAKVLGQPGNEQIRLTPTAFGNRLRCMQEIELHRASGMEWADFSALPAVTKVKGKGLTELLLSGDGASGRFAFADSSLTGSNFQVDRIFGGLAQLRAQTVSTDTSDGSALSREISAIALPFKEQGWFGRVTNKVMLIHLKPNTEACLSQALVLEE